MRKTCVSGRSVRPSSRQTKPRRAGVTAKSSSGSCGSPSPSLKIRACTRRSRFCCRSASPGCGNATTTRWPPRTNAPSSFSASASPRATKAGRCASNANCCPAGSVSRSAAPLNGTGSSPSSAQTVRTSSACQTRSGPPGTGRTRSVGIATGLVVVAQRRLVQIEAPFDGGIDHAGLEWMQRALGERRERAHLLDLVAPELDANGLAPRRRKHVDQPAAHRELTALVGTIDALVARERKRLGELLEADLFAGRDPDRLGPRIRRRHRLGQGGRGCSDETSRRENVERAGTLADEVRHRLETGAPVHAAARQHRDALLAEEPGSAFRRVARVLVFRREQDERAGRALHAARRAAAAAPARTRAPQQERPPRSSSDGRSRGAPGRTDAESCGP